MNQDRHSRIELAVTSLPGIVGIGLGLVYMIGAVQIAGQASAAGHSPRAILPLYPLEAVLSRGIAFGLPFLGFSVVILMAAAMAPIVSQWAEGSRFAGNAVLFLRRPVSRRFLLVESCIAVVFLGIFYSVFAFAFLLMIAAICIVYIRLEHLGWDAAGRTVVSGIAGLLTIAVVGSFLAARPYPECIATLTDRNRLTGKLITQANDVLYIEQKHRLVSVPLRSVRKVSVADSQANVSKPLITIFD